MTQAAARDDHRPRRTWEFLSRHPVTTLRTISESKAHALGELGIKSILDLLTYYPYRYHDRRRQASLAELVEKDEAWVEVEIASVKQVPSRYGRARARTELVVRDDSGHMTVTFFNQPWRAKQLSPGDRVLLFGKLNVFRGRRQLVNPVVDLAADPERRLVPMYRASDKARITSRDFDRWIGEALERTGEIVDPLPETWRKELDLVERTEALRTYHRPADPKDLAPARRRLAFDELLRLQLEVGMRRRAMADQARGIRHDTSGTLVDAFINALPFALTGAQRRAIDAISADMAGELPMHRLLQGDVGAGKTVVAVAAMLTSVQGGHQSALMAPTEVLAEQHHMSVRAMLGDLQVPDHSNLYGRRPLNVALLTGRTPASERRRILGDLARAGGEGGGIDIVVGTHALLVEDVQFADLGLVVIDEQHRFGVEQRAELRSKGRAGGGADPDLLVMTATPIPRTAAMAVFGDLEITELDELPAGRSPVITRWARTEQEEALAWEDVRREVEAGHLAYVVCPLVEGSERIAARSAVQELERLESGVLEGLKLGLLHGQMRPAEKEAVMAAFRSGQVQVLVATTVIEVGVDVRLATVMVIEDAQRFGIAQLHQLRGRVGRSDLPSRCWLLSVASPSPRPGAKPLPQDARRRLEALESSNDGFALAEVDLELRGEGSVLGERQKGRSDLKLASLRRVDRQLVLEARRVAEALLDDDPQLEANPVLKSELRLFVGDEEAQFLFKS